VKTKLENGHSYPPSAYAYVGDAEDPATWRLRLWESGKGLDALRVTEAAAAFESSDIPADARPGARAKVRSALEKTGVEYDRWPASMASSASIDVHEMAVIESAGADPTGKTASVVVIKTGFNSSKRRFYTPDALKSAVPLFEGAKMYIDHATEREEIDRPEGSLTRLGGVLRDVSVRESDGAIVGTAHIANASLRQILANLHESGSVGAIGVSINAIAKGVKRAIDGVQTTVIESLRKVRSVDFVTEAGAGGMVLACESADTLDSIDLETLEAMRPDIVEAIRGGGKDDGTMTLEEALAKIATLEASTKVLESERDALKTERDGLALKIQEAERGALVAKAQGEISALVKESKLPEAAQKRLAEQFKDADKIDGVKEAVEAERAYIDSLRDPGHVRECGGGSGGSEDDGKVLRESFVDSYMARGKTKEEAERLADIAVRG
jgi:hypothetical protein